MVFYLIFLQFPPQGHPPHNFQKYLPFKKYIRIIHLLKIPDIYMCLKNKIQAPDYGMKGHFKYDCNTTFQQLVHILQVPATFNVSLSLMNCHKDYPSMAIAHAIWSASDVPFPSSKLGHLFIL